MWNSTKSLAVTCQLGGRLDDLLLLAAKFRLPVSVAAFALPLRVLPLMNNDQIVTGERMTVNALAPVSAVFSSLPIVDYATPPQPALAARAFPSTTRHIGVSGGQFMTALAVRQGDLSRSEGITAQHVHLVRDGLKMVRVEAGRISTEVVHLKFTLNGPNDHLIDDPIDETRSGIWPIDDTVTQSSATIGPFPAGFVSQPALKVSNYLGKSRVNRAVRHAPNLMLS
jgi:hypothetical protein